MSYLTYGDLYSADQFSPEFRNTLHNFLVLSMQDGAPVATFQAAGTQAHVKVASPLNNPANLGYIFPSSQDASKYVWISQVNVDSSSCLLMTHMTEAFLQYAKWNVALLLNVDIVDEVVTQQTFRWVTLLVKPNCTRTYNYSWKQVAETFQPVTTPAPVYYASVSALDLKLFADPPAFFTPEFGDALYAVAAGTHVPPPLPTLNPGDLLLPAQVTARTPHACYVASMDSAGPHCEWTDSVVHCGVAAGVAAYFVTMGNYELFLGTSASFVYVAPDFRDWLAKHHVLAFALADCVLLLAGRRASVWAVPLSPNAEPFNTSALGAFVDAHQEAVALAFTLPAAWLTEDVCKGLALAYESRMYDPIDLQDEIKETELAQGLHILYTQSLYTENGAFFDAAAAQLAAELVEEQTLSAKLTGDEASSDDAALTQSLREFIATKSAEVALKVGSLRATKQSLESLIEENTRRLAANADLHDLVYSPEAVALHQNIMTLRDLVHDGVAFLQTKGRGGELTLFRVNRVRV